MVKNCNIVVHGGGCTHKNVTISLWLFCKREVEVAESIKAPTYIIADHLFSRTPSTHWGKTPPNSLYVMLLSASISSLSLYPLFCFEENAATPAWKLLTNHTTLCTKFCRNIDWGPVSRNGGACSANNHKRLCNFRQRSLSMRTDFSTLDEVCGSH